MFKNIILNRIIVICYLILVFTVSVKAKTFNLQKLAIFPLYNISGHSYVPQEIAFKIAKKLQEHNIDIVLPTRLEDFFLRKRIRRFGTVTQAQAKELKKLFGVDAIVVSWVDLYDNGEHPKIGIGLRIIESETGTILWGNYVALVSEDFVSWFCRGEIKSVDKLIEDALKRLLADFPKEFEIEQIQPLEEKPLFVLQDFSFSPEITKGGQSVNVALKIVALKKLPQKVFLLLGGKKWTLKKEKDGWWSGVIFAPIRQGRYYAKLKLVSDNNHYQFLHTGHFLEVDNTAPEIKISCENTIFSPNGDNTKDVVIFFPSLVRPDKIKLWSFFITNTQNQIIRRFDGSGDLPLGLAWHGENDQFNKVAEGVYYLQGVCQDEAGNITFIGKKKIVIDKTAPKLDLLAVIEKEKVKFKFKCEENIRVAKWSLNIFNDKQDIYYLTDGNGSPPEEITLSLPNKDIKVLHVLAEVFDCAGNRTEYRNSLLIRDETLEKRKEEREERKLLPEWDYDF